jgi:hypothetical protein
MSVDTLLSFAIRVADALEVHQDPEVRTLGENLQHTCVHIRTWHRDPKLFDVGYTCLEQPAQQSRLLAALECLKSILLDVPPPPPGAPYRRPNRKLRMVRLSPEDMSKIRELTLELGRVVLEERLTGYIPYSLNTLRRLPEWRHSPFRTMEWGEVNAALLEQNSDLLELITSITTNHDYDPAVLKLWIHLRAEFVAKDFYISRTAEDLKIFELAGRVFWDEQTRITMDETDLTTRGLLLAFWTFRNDWYKELRRGHYVHTKMARKWIGERYLQMGNFEIASAWLKNVDEDLELNDINQDSDSDSEF